MKVKKMNKNYVIKVPTSAIDNTTAAEYKMLGAICSYINENNECSPSYKLLAERCSICRRLAKRYVKNLKDKGLIKVRTRFSENGKSLTNIFSVIFEAGEVNEKFS